MTENASAGVPFGDVDQLAEQLMDRADSDQAQLLGPDGLLTQLTQRVLNRALDVELAEHLGYEKGDPAGRGTGNNRNGATTKTVLTDIGAVPVTVPRDRGTAGPRDRGTATAASSRRWCPNTRGAWPGSTSRS